MLTPRFYWLGMVCPALLLLSVVFPFLPPIAALYGVGLLILAVLDRAAAGPISQFEITRHHDQKLSLGAQNQIVLRACSRAGRPVVFMLQDEAPHAFAGWQTGCFERVLQPRQVETFAYHVRPLRRGDYRFGDVHARWSGPARFFVRQGTIAAAASVKVYPNLREIQKFDMLLRRDRLAEMGLRNIRLRGEGTAFESLREYTPDDQYRAINWKASARRGKLIATDYEPERSQRVMAMLDVGRMMRSPIRVEEPGAEAWDMAKVDFVVNSVLLFSYVAILKGDQVGLLVFADQVQQYLPPESGAGQFQKLLSAMYALESQPVEADYGRALNYLSLKHKKRSLVTLFTDLSGARASESLLANLPRLAPRHLPLLVTIRDPAIDQQARQPITDSDALYRRAVAEQMLDERRLLMDNLARRGVLCLDVDAQRLSMAVVNRYLELKLGRFAG